MELDREIEQHRDGGRACDMAHEVNQRIIADDEALPQFAQVSQNITAVMALPHELPRPTTPEDHRAHHEIRTLLERAAVQ